MVRVMLSYWNQKFADFEEQERGVDHLEQEVQQAVNTLDNYRQYFTDYMPELTKFGLKVVAAILIFIGGRKVIQWIIYLIKASMEKASVDKGVVQFIGSLLRVCLYILLVFTIATHFGVKESSVAALLGTAGVTVGLALQGGLANIAGGVLLLTFKPFLIRFFLALWHLDHNLFRNTSKGLLRNFLKFFRSDLYFFQLLTLAKGVGANLCNILTDNNGLQFLLATQSS